MCLMCFFVSLFVLSFCLIFFSCFVFFFHDTATTEIYTLSLHDALPISARHAELLRGGRHRSQHRQRVRRRRRRKRSEEHTSELQSRQYLVCRLLLEKKKKKKTIQTLKKNKNKNRTRDK